jgi:ribonuclease J
MTKLAFYGGVNEIGGNKVLLRDKKTKVFFDFGQSFSMGKNLFVDWLAPRNIYGLKDYFEFDLLPKIKGLYGKKQLLHTDLSYTYPEINSVILSHAHFDHIAHIRFVDRKIPLFCGACTKLFIEAQRESTPSDANHHIYKTFRTGDTLEIDPFTVEPVHVDHSIPGAYGFIIHTSKGAIVYTGDFRAHGPKKEMTEGFIEKSASCDPVALITEGTRMVEKEKRSNYSESEIKEKSNSIVSETDKIVFVTHYGRDTDRFRTMYEVAKENNRKIIIPPKTAYLLSKMLSDNSLELPDPLQDNNILVYYKRKKSGTYVETDYYLWERAFMDKMVDSKYVHENQRSLVMDLGFYQFGELIDIKPERGSNFIHSMSEPFSEEDIEDRVMRNWLAHFGITFHQLHASGHLNKYELTDMITRMNPKIIFPIHTENPRLFKKKFNNTIIIRKQKPYSI